MHFDPTTIGIAGALLLGVANLVLHIAKPWTIAAKAATWFEQNEKTLETVADVASKATQAAQATAAKK